MRLIACSLLLATFISAPTVVAQSSSPSNKPITPQHLPTSSTAQGTQFMVSATNPYVTATGYEVLAHGGNAIDAMVGMQMVMSVVEPDMTGIGGGSFVLYYDKSNDKIRAYDGREVAPASAYPSMFITDHGKPLTRNQILGPRSVAVPGTLRLLYNLHQEHGQLAWDKLLQPAIRYAEDGYAMNSYTHAIMVREQARLQDDPAIKAMYWDKHGKIRHTGALVKNPALAATLKAIAQKGDSAFYDGKIAQHIVDKVNQQIDSDLPQLSMTDFQNYQIKEREVVTSDYRGYRVASFGYPASGGMMVAQTLALLSSYSLGQYALTDAEPWRLMTQAMRIAKADRIAYAGDPDFVATPTLKMLAPEYLKIRSSLMTDTGAMANQPKAGNLLHVMPNEGQDNEGKDTGHISIVDRDGNAIAMTSTVGTGMGAGIMVDGVILNAQMANFTIEPSDHGKLAQNRIQAGKRPRSAVTPLMMFNPDGTLRLVVGSPGSSQIPGYVLKTVVGMVDWGLTAQQAIDLPNIQYGVKIDRTKSENPSGLLVEKTSFAETLVPAFTQQGYNVSVIPMISGLNAVEVTEHGLHGASDRRRAASSMGK